MQQLLPRLVQLAEVGGPGLAAKAVHHGAVGGVDQLDDGFAQSGLTAAGLPHQSQGLAPVDVQVYVIDRLDVIGHLVEKAAADGEEGFDAPQLQQNFFFLTHRDAASSLGPE